MNTKTKISIIGLKDLRENMTDYISQINKGGSFIVVRKSKPVFRITPIDEWGDEGSWESIIDFTKIRKGGVLAEDIIAKKQQNEHRRKNIGK